MFELSLIPVFLLVGLVLMAMAAYWGSYSMAIISAIVAWFSRNKLLDKFALQLSRLSLIGLLLFFGFCLALSAGIIFGAMGGLELEGLVAMLPKQLWLALSLVFGSGLLFQVLTFLSWNILKKNRKGIHLLFGILGFFGLWASLWLGVNGACALSSAAGLESDWILKPADVLIPVVPAYVWPFFTWLVFVNLGAGGIIAAGYLLWRRDKDDFGRDYYQVALRRTAKWGLFFGPQFFVVLEMSYFGLGGDYAILFQTAVLSIGIGIVLGVFLLCFLLLALVRSQKTLRMKGTVILSVLICWAVLSLTSAWLSTILQSGPFLAS